MKTLPIGYDIYKHLFDSNCYYVDKTLILKEIIESTKDILIFHKPRLYGKTLLLTMIRTFFEKEINKHGQYINNSKYFEHSKIVKEYPECLQYNEEFPIIFLSMKHGVQPSFEMAWKSIADEISKEYIRHSYILLNEEISDSYKDTFQYYMRGIYNINECIGAINLLSECLSQAHKQQVIIIIDEYNTPIEHALIKGFCTEMLTFINSFYEKSITNNAHLKFAIMAGCYPHTVDTIFNSNKNIGFYDIYNTEYQQYFGITKDETENILDYYELSEEFEVCTSWYGGNISDDANMYNPWSLMNHISKGLTGKNIHYYPEAYSSNGEINKLIDILLEKYPDHKRTIEKLINYEYISPQFDNPKKSEPMNQIWIKLLNAGYLSVKTHSYVKNSDEISLAIPNKEVRLMWKKRIYQALYRSLSEIEPKTLEHFIINKNVAELQKVFNQILENNICIPSDGVYFYSHFVTTILSVHPKYIIYSDSAEKNFIIMKRPYIDKIALIFDVQVINGSNNITPLKNPKYNQLTNSLLEEGYSNVVIYRFHFQNNNCNIDIIQL